MEVAESPSAWSRGCRAAGYLLGARPGAPHTHVLDDVLGTSRGPVG